MTDNVSLRSANPKTDGMEIFEIRPVLLGGIPVDLENKLVLTRAKHIVAVRYWNNIIRNMRRKASR